VQWTTANSSSRAVPVRHSVQRKVGGLPCEVARGYGQQVDAQRREPVRGAGHGLGPPCMAWGSRRPWPRRRAPFGQPWPGCASRGADGERCMPSIIWLQFSIMRFICAGSI
jgi:hypothetical protein